MFTLLESLSAIAWLNITVNIAMICLVGYALYLRNLTTLFIKKAHNTKTTSPPHRATVLKKLLKEKPRIPNTNQESKYTGVVMAFINRNKHLLLHTQHDEIKTIYTSPELVTHAVARYYSNMITKVSWLAYVGTAAGLSFTVLSFVLLAAFDGSNESASILGSMMALTTTWFGILASAVANRQRSRLRYAMEVSVSHIEDLLCQQFKKHFTKNLKNLNKNV